MSVADVASVIAAASSTLAVAVSVYTHRRSQAAATRMDRVVYSREQLSADLAALIPAAVAIAEAGCTPNVATSHVAELVMRLVQRLANVRIFGNAKINERVEPIVVNALVVAEFANAKKTTDAGQDLMAATWALVRVAREELNLV